MSVVKGHLAWTCRMLNASLQRSSEKEKQQKRKLLWQIQYIYKKRLEHWSVLSAPFSLLRLYWNTRLIHEGEGPNRCKTIHIICCSTYGILNYIPIMTSKNEAGGLMSQLCMRNIFQKNWFESKPCDFKKNKWQLINLCVFICEVLPFMKNGFILQLMSCLLTVLHRCFQ